MEPDYLAQTAEPMTREQARQWLDARAVEAKEAGITHARASWDDKYGILLFEGWKEPPVKDGAIHEGEPRFQFQNAEVGHQQ